METIKKEICFLLKDKSEKKIFSNIIITDDDIKYLLSIKKTEEIIITFYECYIIINKTKSKELLEFIQKYNVKGCEFFFNKTSPLNKKIVNIINSENVICNLNFIEIYLKRNNNSLKNLSAECIKKLKLKNTDLSKADLSCNKDFFQNINKKKLEGITLPPINFKEFNVQGVEFLDCKFADGTIFSNDFFQQIKNKKIVGCTFPKIDFSNININEVTFMFIHFSKNTIFPEDSNFFKRFNLMYACSLPPYDYTKYIFEGVNMDYCLFRENSSMPLTHSLNENNINNKYPKSFAKLLHLIPVENIDYEEIVFRYGKYLTEQQKVILYFKLKKQ